MGWYQRYCLPGLLDFACGLSPIGEQRDKIVPAARGEVLEIGIGTGRNLGHYDPDNIRRIWGLDPATSMQSRLCKRLAGSRLDVRLLTGSAQAIPAADARFDTVVITYTLCSIAEPVAALREIARVLRPGGRLLFCEHGLAPDPGVARWQRRLTPAWRRIAGDCRMDRDIPGLLRRAGLAIADLQQTYIPGPRVLSYNYWGIAQGR